MVTYATMSIIIVTTVLLAHECAQLYSLFGVRTIPIASNSHVGVIRWTPGLHSLINQGLLIQVFVVQVGLDIRYGSQLRCQWTH